MRLPWGAVAVAALSSVLLRLRMYWTPITSDEAGFLVIARAWAHGHVLYRDVWVDRPQGIIVLYRLWDWTSGGSVASIRIMAMLFGVALVIGVASIATQLAGPSAGAVAALLVAATSANPAIEGHLANGELLAGAVAVAGLALGLQRDHDRSHPAARPGRAPRRLRAVAQAERLRGDRDTAGMARSRTPPRLADAAGRPARRCRVDRRDGHRGRDPGCPRGDARLVALVVRGGRPPLRGAQRGQ